MIILITLSCAFIVSLLVLIVILGVSIDKRQKELLFESTFYLRIIDRINRVRYIEDLAKWTKEAIKEERYEEAKTFQAIRNIEINLYNQEYGEENKK